MGLMERILIKRIIRKQAKKNKKKWLKRDIMESNVPCVENHLKIHIMGGDTKCLCGKKYEYIDYDKRKITPENIWRSFDYVTCSKCKKKYIKTFYKYWRYSYASDNSY